ncbi:hypothetical protein [Nocardia iowensis]|uniref:Uncharacterized protein n=1 Tax=Nocardia iowensis TaxID=204891 RepID=A0ABX8RTY4_NOCIO|nr:hypothetical protein [Nocardia iowensis]QXN93043.1 hypothetical protein KV110_08035 [Nocardia iowensis]
MMVRTVVAATLALAPAAVIIPAASARPCVTPTEIGCHGGFHHDPPKSGLDDDFFGYGMDGFDGSGRDRFGRDRFGYDRSGYDRWGYDRWGYDRNGFTREGCARNGADRPDADAGKCERLRSRPSSGSSS